MRWAVVVHGLALTASLLSGCGREARVVDPDLPLSAPSGAADPRRLVFESNAFQIAQGGRYFAWYGCGHCHGAWAQGAADLADGRWTHGATVDRIYAAIADHGQAAAHIPVEQLWQIAAYVRELPKLDPALRRRQELDEAAEPQAGAWAGPLR